MSSPVAIGVVAVYLLAVSGIALCMAGRQTSASAFLRGEGDLPWWGVCLSIVATETSTLTVISVPGIAYGNGLVFVGLGLGYLIGRALVAWWLLPLSMRGDAVSAYDYLGRRFGPGMQRLAAATFLVTRLLAEAVRLAAAGLPVAALLGMNQTTPGWILAAIVAATLLYTMLGGVRAVVWSDSLQFALYLFGAAACVGVLATRVDAASWHAAWQAGRFQVFLTHAPILSSPYAPATALIGGAVLSMASHGADQLMVQRVLACRTLADGRRALVASAVVVTVLFALLSLIGVGLWAQHGGQSLASLGLTSSDALFPDFIAHALPPWLAGLLVAGILAATMGSLSAALNAMTASCIGDLGGGWLATRLGPSGLLVAARGLTLGWAALMLAVALAFSASAQPVVVLGLIIAGYAYGALLGAFVYGRVLRDARTADAVAGFAGSLIGMALLFATARQAGIAIAFPWLVPIGVALFFATGCVARLARR